MLRTKNFISLYLDERHHIHESSYTFRSNRYRIMHKGFIVYLIDKKKKIVRTSKETANNQKVLGKQPTACF